METVPSRSVGDIDWAILRRLRHLVVDGMSAWVKDLHFHFFTAHVACIHCKTGGLAGEDVGTHSRSIHVQFVEVDCLRDLDLKLIRDEELEPIFILFGVPTDLDHIQKPSAKTNRKWSVVDRHSVLNRADHVLARLVRNE